MLPSLSPCISPLFFFSLYFLLLTCSFPPLYVHLVSFMHRHNYLTCSLTHSLICFFHLVDGGHRAVIFDRFRGVLPHVAGEGTHFFIPWVQKPIIYDVRSNPRNIPVVTPSKGMLMEKCS